MRSDCPRPVYRLRCVAAALLLACSTMPSLAVLGRASTSDSAPPVSYRATPQLNQQGALLSYSRREHTLASGTVVQEYADANGLVFAIAWSGPALPDFSVCLGDYAGVFRDAARQARPQRSLGTPLSVVRDGLVLRSGGRMRNFQGYAYVPALLPSGVRPEDVLP